MDHRFITFYHPMLGELRATIINDKIWFVGVDAAKALGYSNYRKAVFEHVSKQDKYLKNINIMDKIEN